jgi:hypothetical protein
VARSLGSDGSDGDRNVTPGVAPFSAPDPVPANATPGVAPFSAPDPVPANATPGVAPFWSPRASLTLLLLLPALALADPAPAGLAECRRVERYAGDVAEAAAAMSATAATVTAAGRLHSLQRLRDRLADLDRSILDLERAVSELEGAVEPEE